MPLSMPSNLAAAKQMLLRRHKMMGLSGGNFLIEADNATQLPGETRDMYRTCMAVQTPVEGQQPLSARAIVLARR